MSIMVQDPVYKDIIEIYKTQGADNYNYYDTDWKDLVLKDSGFQQSHSVSVSGWNEAVECILPMRGIIIKTV